METETKSVVFVDNAMALHEKGFHVIPLTSKDKTALVVWKKYQTEKPNKKQILEWCKTFPNANIGIVTGIDFIVVDVDGPEGLESLKGKEFTPTLMANTGRGWHYFYRVSKKTATRLSLVKKVDLKGIGSYVVCPPSIHPNGKIYNWNMDEFVTKHGGEFSIDKLPEVPDWVDEICKQTEDEAIKSPKWWDNIKDGVDQGGRNEAAAKIAGYHLGQGMKPDAVMMVLQGWNIKNHPPLNDKELMVVINSIYKKEESHQLPSMPPIDLKTCKEVIAKWLYYNDPTVVDLVLATTLSVVTNEDPVWLLLVSAPSMGKTELLRALEGSPLTYYIGSVTKNTFFSGLKNVKGILERIGEKKLTLVNKDFSSVLSMASFDRVDLLGQMRDIYDGTAGKEFGNGKVVSWHGKLNYIGGVTFDIESHYAVIRALGERYMYYRIDEPSQAVRHKMLEKSMLMENHSDEARREITCAMQGVLSKYIECDISKIKLDGELDAWLRELVNITTLLRTYVPRDGYTHDLLYKPSAEGPTRVYKAIKTLTKVLALIRGKNEVSPNEYDVAVKICLDSMPSMRRETLKAIIHYCGADGAPGAMPKEIAEMTNYQATSTCKYLLDDLAAIGALDRCLPRNLNDEIHQNMPYLYSLNKDIKKRMTECGIIEAI